MTLPPVTGSASLPPRPELPRLEPPHAMFGALRIASSGLTAQRTRMEVIAQNLANAETTRTPEGGPYRRRLVELEPIAPPVAEMASSATTGAAGATGNPTDSTGAVAGAVAGATAAGSPNTGNAATTPTGETNDVFGGVRVRSITEDTTDGPLVYDPGNPDADKNGYVRMPNVNMTDELVDLMNARRIYEANATVFQVAKAMLHRAIDI